jgi:hypothetical protein
VTNENQEQQKKLEDFPESNKGEICDGKITVEQRVSEIVNEIESGKKNPSGFREQAELLSQFILGFRSQDVSPPSEVTEAMETILEEAEPPIKVPPLVCLLDKQWITRELLLKHLLEEPERPLRKIPKDVDIDMDIFEEQDLSLGKRWDCYAALARGPADSSIFRKIKKKGKIIEDSTPSVIDHNPTGLIQESARRVLLGFARERREDISETTAKKCLDEAWNNIDQDLLDVVTELGKLSDKLHFRLLEKLRGGKTEHLSRSGFLDGVIKKLSHIEQKESRQRLTEIAIAAIEGGIKPAEPRTTWDNLEGMIFDGGNLDSIETVAPRIINDQIAEYIDTKKYINLIEEEYQAESEKRSGEVNENSIGIFLSIIEETVSISDDSILSDEELRQVASIAIRSTTENKSRAVNSLINAADSQEKDILLTTGVLEKILDAIDKVEDSKELDIYGSLLKEAGVYPPPNQIKAHYGSTDEEIDTKAKKIARDLRSLYQKKEYTVSPKDIEGDFSQIAENLTIKYRADSGIWKPLSLSRIDREFLNQVWEVIRNKNANQITLPYHHPPAFRLVVLTAVLFTLIDEEYDDSSLTSGNSQGIAIYSPGTHTRWGTLKDIKKECMNRMGISVKEGPSAHAAPLMDMVPRGKVKDGQVQPETSSTTISNPETIPISRNLEDLAEIEPDIIIYNFLSEVSKKELLTLQRIRGTTGQSDNLSGDSSSKVQEDIVELNDHSPLEIYAAFTKQVQDGWHIDTGAPRDISNNIIPASGYLEGKLHAGSDTNQKGTVPPQSKKRAKHAHNLINTAPEVLVHKVRASESLHQALSRIYEIIEDIDGDDLQTPKRRLYSIKTELEGLPVPASHHDSWILEQRKEKNPYVPRRTAERVNALNNLADEYTSAVRHISDAAQEVEQIFKSIQEENPLFKALLGILDDARNKDQEVGILCLKKSYKDMLYEYLLDQANVDSQKLDQFITLLDGDSIRDIQDVDRLIRFGVGRPHTAPYYCHPVVDRVDVVAYDGTNPVYRIEKLIETRSSVFPRKADISVDIPVVEDTQVVLGESGSEIPRYSNGKDSFEDSLLLSFIGDEEPSGSSSRGNSSRERYRISLDDGSIRTVSDTRPLIVRNQRDLVSEGEYIIQYLSETTHGDTVVTIPSSTRNDLWEEYLESHYSEDVDWVVERVELWYDAISRAIKQAKEDDISAIKKIYNQIGSEIPEKEPAVRTWVDSVKDANGPRDLIYRRNLTMGPGHEKAVNMMADKYGDSVFRSNSDDVFNAMESIRREHASRGHDFWLNVADMGCDGSLFDYPGVTEREIEKIKKIT